MDKYKYDFNIVTPLDACDINYYKMQVLMYKAKINGMLDCINEPGCTEGIKTELLVEIEHFKDQVKYYEAQVARYV